MESSERKRQIDFSNTEIAFSDKTNKELKRMYWLFRFMNNRHFVRITSRIGLFAVKYSMPLAKTIVKATIFEQFCGGENLLDSQAAIDKLYRSDVLTILDYGAEGKSGEAELEKVAEEFIRGVEFAASNISVPVISIKLTAIGENEILTKSQEILRNSSVQFSKAEQRSYDLMVNRLQRICKRANELEVGVFIDAEESWMQDTIDVLANEMMARYNKERVAVYNTFQMYRVDRLEYLKKSYEIATKEGYLLGAKLVRGAYMDKERERAKEMEYTSPIHASKEDTDESYDLGLKFCLDNFETIASCAATHNERSCLLQAALIEERNMPNDHPHLNFCQLLGMSDNITYNLADAGYNVAKYVVYGKVKEVVPYLVRRAEENTSVTGDIGRELNLISKEKQRRAL